MNNKSRWQAFRVYDDSIPSTPYEAAVFVQNARLHLMASDVWENLEARRVLSEATDRINDTFFDETFVEGA